MTPRTFARVSGAMFSLIAFLHLLRLIVGWEAAIGGWTVPMWVSWIAVAVFGALAYAASRVR